jgi:serine/threonine protein kinase
LYLKQQANLLHRDLKIANFCFDSNMELKLIDFGCAIVVKNEMERRFSVCGHIEYFAPEKW